MTEVASYGKPVIGGPFSLVSSNGKSYTDRSFRGKYMLVYFGFTNCPEICPAEMSKMTEVMNLMDETVHGKLIQPIFITVDPQRDTTEVLERYKQRMHVLTCLNHIRFSSSIACINWTD